MRHRLHRPAAITAIVLTVLLLGGCIANPYDGLWAPQNGSGAPVNPYTGTQDPDTTNR